MPQIDKRSAANQHDSGSDIGLEVYLTEAIAQKYYGAQATAGWYVIGTLAGGTLGRQVESEAIRDESGRRTGKKVKTSDEYSLGNRFYESDDATLDLLDEELVERQHKYRYALPAGETAEGDKLHQLYGFEDAEIEPGWEQQTEAGQVRGRPFTLVCDASNVVRKTVDLTDEENWDPALAPFKTAQA